MSSQKRALSQYSDDEVRELYARCNNNAADASREVGCGPSTFRQRINLLNDPTYVSEKDKVGAMAYLMEELEARGIDARQIKIKKATVRTRKNRWNAMHKNAHKEAVITPLKSDARYVSIEFSPKFEEGPQWPLIQQPAAAPIAYTPSNDVKPGSFRERVFLLPDVQIGFYRHIVTGELTPFHDLAAIDAALQLMYDYKPTLVVIQGDFLDCQSLSRWLQVAEFQLTMQPSIDYAYKLLCKIRSIVGPKCKIVYIEGNHERRVAEFIAKNALAAYGLRQGGHTPESWPVMSIPHLLRLDELKVDYTSAYPAGEYWITPKLVCTHQPPSAKKDMRATVVHGHTPHYKVDDHTVHMHGGIETFYRYSIPGLMRIDNVSDKTALVQTSVPSNAPRASINQGVGTIDVVDEDFFNVLVHKIDKGRLIYFNRVYHGNAKAAR